MTSYSRMRGDFETLEELQECVTEGGKIKPELIMDVKGSLPDRFSCFTETVCGEDLLIGNFDAGGLLLLSTKFVGGPIYTGQIQGVSVLLMFRTVYLDPAEGQGSHLNNVADSRGFAESGGELFTVGCEMKDVSVIERRYSGFCFRTSRKYSIRDSGFTNNFTDAEDPSVFILESIPVRNPDAMLRSQIGITSETGEVDLVISADTSLKTRVEAWVWAVLGVGFVLGVFRCVDGVIALMTRPKGLSASADFNWVSKQWSDDVNEVGSSAKPRKFAEVGLRDRGGTVHVGARENEPLVGVIGGRPIV